jgi:hypothetical protein
MIPVKYSGFFFLLLLVGISLPATAQEGIWRVSAEPGVSIVGVGNAKALPVGQSLNRGYSDVTPALLLRVSRQTTPTGKWRVGLRAEVATWQVNKGIARLNSKGQLTGEGAIYLGWPAISLAPSLYRRLTTGRGELGAAAYAGIAWGSGRKPAVENNGLTNQYFSASTGFSAGVELQGRYAISHRFSLAASAGAQRNWMMLVDGHEAGFTLNCLSAGLGAMYHF